MYASLRLFANFTSTTVVTFDSLILDRQATNDQTTDKTPGCPAPPNLRTSARISCVVTWAHSTTHRMQWNVIYVTAEMLF